MKLSYATPDEDFNSAAGAFRRRRAALAGLDAGEGREVRDCTVWSHQFGFELRLTVGAELVQSQVCRTQEDLIAYQEKWRAGLETKGWTKS